MDFPNVEKWVLVTFSDGDTTYRFLFIHVKLPGGGLDNREFCIKHFDPTDLVAETKDEAIQLAGEGFELGFDLDYLSPANEPFSIILALANRNNHHGIKYFQNILNKIRWIRHFGNFSDKDLCLESTFETLQAWEVN
ncbi:hypothetical protein LY622_05975 [Halomonas sp. M5N1S17]|uniref:hypothetical protein n=1 Tax=Halomonas alkalisoli TaxID=2907158 RepID=UPI001F42D6D4|nr:hypothetical protein [Halomonas alkalisoli]MCE9662981.1 hypothetical protein [Halomonas alkalisoli]